MCNNIAKCGFYTALEHITNNCLIKIDLAKY